MLAGARDLGSSRMLGSFILNALVIIIVIIGLIVIQIWLLLLLISYHIKPYHNQVMLMSICLVILITKDPRCPTWFCFLRAFSRWPELILLTIWSKRPRPDPGVGRPSCSCWTCCCCCCLSREALDLSCGDENWVWKRALEILQSQASQSLL